MDFTVPFAGSSWLSSTDVFDELSARGVDVIAISAETRERAEQLQAGWKLERLPIAYGLAEPSMREWGLSSRGGRGDDEPTLFNEPGLALSSQTERSNTSRSGRCQSGGRDATTLVDGIDYWTKVGYPARGDA